MKHVVTVATDLLNVFVRGFHEVRPLFVTSENGMNR